MRFILIITLVVTVTLTD